MNHGKVFRAPLVFVAAILGAGCASSSPDANELAARVRASVDRQEAEAVALGHALASAQRDAANAKWDHILNAAAQNFRFRHGLALDAPLTDAQHDAVDAIARSNLAKILAHVNDSESALIEAIARDYSNRAKLLERLVRDLDGDAARRQVLEELERLEVDGRPADVERAVQSFKQEVERQLGYVGGG